MAVPEQTLAVIFGYIICSNLWWCKHKYFCIYIYTTCAYIYTNLNICVYVLIYVLYNCVIWIYMYMCMFAKHTHIIHCRIFLIFYVALRYASSHPIRFIPVATSQFKITCYVVYFWGYIRYFWRMTKIEKLYEMGEYYKWERVRLEWGKYIRTISVLNLWYWKKFKYINTSM